MRGIYQYALVSLEACVLLVRAWLIGAAESRGRVVQAAARREPCWSGSRDAMQLQKILRVEHHQAMGLRAHTFVSGDEAAE